MTYASNFGGPAGPTYQFVDTGAAYGTVDPLSTSNCYDATGDCYRVRVTGTRPAAHWDATFDEITAPIALDGGRALLPDLDDPRRRELLGRPGHGSVLSVHRNALPHRGDRRRDLRRLLSAGFRARASRWRRSFSRRRRARLTFRRPLPASSATFSWPTRSPPGSRSSIGGASPPAAEPSRSSTARPRRSNASRCRSSCSRRSWAPHTCRRPPSGSTRTFHHQPLRPVDRGPHRPGHRGGMRRGQLLSHQLQQPRPDGGVSDEDIRPHPLRALVLRPPVPPNALRPGVESAANRRPTCRFREESHLRSPRSSSSLRFPRPHRAFRHGPPRAQICPLRRPRFRRDPALPRPSSSRKATVRRSRTFWVSAARSSRRAPSTTVKTAGGGSSGRRRSSASSVQCRSARSSSASRVRSRPGGPASPSPSTSACRSIPSRMASGTSSQPCRRPFPT